MRPLACLFLGLIVLASFKISTGSTNIIAYRLAIAVICVSFATMVQNDLRDRWHDTKKGKRFALENEHSFKRFVFALWMLALFASWLVCRENIGFACILGLGIIIGLIYSELRLIPMIPNSIVALCNGTTALFPIFTGIQSAMPCWILFTSIMVVMLFREILKDFDDREIDPGYKWTLLQWIRLGQKDARIKGDISPKTVGRLKLTLDIGMTLLMFLLIFR